MDPLDSIQAISAGVCFYAGITHLLIGLRSRPRDRVHLSFAAVSILFGIYSIGLFFLYAALNTGSLDYYVFTDRWGIAANYLALAALFYFIAVYSGSGKRSIIGNILLWSIIGLYVLIAMLCFILPYPWVYTDIELTSTFPPNIVVAQWYSVEQVFTFLLILVYSGYQIVGQFRRGERDAARALGAAVGVFLVTLLWDYGIEYGLINTVLMQQYGFVAFIMIMGLRLSSRTVETEKEIRKLNVELEDRVDNRTKELNNVNQALRGRILELATLHTIAQTIATVSDLPKALQEAAGSLSDLYQARVTLITTPSDGDKELATLVGFDKRADMNLSNVTFPLPEMPISRRVLATGKTEIVDDLRALELPHALQTFISELDLQSIVLVPLKLHGQVVGLLVLGFDQAGRDFDLEEVTIAETIAGDIAAAIENARLTEQARRAAVDAERQRLARELHDSVTQSLYSLTLLSSGWGSMAEQGTLEDPVDSFRQLGEVGGQALKEMRLLIHQLRPSALDEVGLVQALQQRLDIVELRANVESRLLTKGEVDNLPPALEEQLYQIAQEALNNSLRHAHASEVLVEIHADEERVTLSVQDDGLGFDPNMVSAGMGLVNMRERAEVIQGNLRITSAPGEGTQVEVSIPYDTKENV